MYKDVIINQDIYKDAIIDQNIHKDAIIDQDIYKNTIIDQDTHKLRPEDYFIPNNNIIIKDYTANKAFLNYIINDLLRK